jgi:DTW domain-containing protein YfiP
MSDETRCARCARKTSVCVCDRAEVLPTRTRVLVLQHPQEDDVEFGTVPLLTLSLPRAQVAVGLS